MNILVVGGTFGENQKPSGVIKKLGNHFSQYGECKVVNGGAMDELMSLSIKLEPYDLILWMVNVDNDEGKFYPRKGRGAVLIASKVLREQRTEVDAITRIFKMHGNAVIAITQGETFSFKLLDALGNVWVETSDLELLAEKVIEFNAWTKESVRVGTKRYYPDDLEEVVALNKKVADKFEKVKGRYFGNVSTRCLNLFPSLRTENAIYVSKRNVSKHRLDVNDMIMVMGTEEGLKYLGLHKPSVDTPVQLELYKMFPHVNYMIHGHTYVEGAEMTEHYFPCGDMREVDAVKGLIKENGAINLKNHGFLIYSDTIEHLRKIVDEVILIERKVGFEQV